MSISKPSIKDLFKNVLAEIKGFKFQITLKILLSKYKENAEREFDLVYFNSTTKTLNVFEDSHDRSSQELLNRIDKLYSKSSGWVIESIGGEYVKFSI